MSDTNATQTVTVPLPQIVIQINEATLARAIADALAGTVLTTRGANPNEIKSGAVIPPESR